MLAGLVTLLEVVDAVVAWPASGVLQDAASAGVAAWNAPLTWYDAVGLPLFGLQVACWLLTALWLTRARRNAQLLNPWATRSRSTVWVWLGWWVPIVSLWFPFQVVRDLCRATAGDQHRANTVVGWWWAMWLLYTVTTQAGVRISTSTQPEPVLAGALGAVETADAAFATAALVLWVRILVQITRDQQTAALRRPPLNPPPGQAPAGYGGQRTGP